MKVNDLELLLIYFVQSALVDVHFEWLSRSIWLMIMRVLRYGNWQYHHGYWICWRVTGFQVYADEIDKLQSQFEKGAALKLLSFILNRFPNIARRSQKRRVWFETSMDCRPFSPKCKSSEDFRWLGMGNIHHVSLSQVSLVSETRPMTWVGDVVVTEDDWVVSVWNEALGSKSGVPAPDIFSSTRLLGTIRSKSTTEGGSGYIFVY
jgi:hypothetical protein